MGAFLSRSKFRSALSRVPLRMLLVVPFVVQVSAAVGLTGWLSIRHGQQAVNNVATQLRDSVAYRIEYQLEDFLAVPHLVNQLNHDAVVLGQLDPDDPDALSRHFLQQAHTFESVASIFFGHANGKFIGHSYLGGEQHQHIQGRSSLGEDIRFTVIDPDGQALELLNVVPGWVTQTRPWYRAAEQARQPVWGEIFPYHAFPMLAVSTSMPVYGEDGELIGVFGNNFFLPQISDFLSNIQVSDHGQAYIIERSGLLVASSTLPHPYEIVDGQPRRLYSITSPDPLIKASSQFLMRAYGGMLEDVQTSTQFEFSLDGQRQFMQVVPFTDSQGLDWLIVVVMPESDFMAQIESNRRNTIALCALALMVAIASGLVTSRWIVGPIQAFSQASQAIARGDLDQQISHTGLKELEGLALAFNTMAVRLESSFNDLRTSKLKLETANAEINQQAEVFRLIAENMSDLVCLHTATGEYVYVSPSAEWLLGYPPRALLGKHPCELVHPADQPLCHPEQSPQVLAGVTSVVTLRMRHQLGHYIWVETFTRPILDNKGRVLQLQTAARDVTETMRMRRQLEHDAFHDSLTGLPNRKLLEQRLDQSLRRAWAHPSYQFGLLFIDLDRFKVINDSLGHLIGDELLIEMASRLKSSVRPSDMVVRLGGDEFIVLLDDISDIDSVTRHTKRILAALRQPLQLSSHEIYITVSIGLVIGTAEYQAADDLVRDADIAMYRAKANGRDSFAVFDSSMHQRAIARMSLETDLRRTLLDNPQNFEVYYQPIVDLRTSAIQGFEALVRWRHPQRGLVSPAEFIPIAEETGLIVPLSQSLMAVACHQLKQWQTTFTQAQNLTVSINLSPLQLHDAGLLEDVDRILQTTGLPPNSLVLEITESMLIGNVDETLAVLQALQRRSIAISIDDFGTGYSSLSYLYKFPIDHLKIDRSFISQMQSSPHHRKIVATIVTLAHQMGFQAIAEGIETQEQVGTLKMLQCDYGQGYWFSYPQPAADMEIWMSKALAHCRSGSVA
ncbi:MAG: EAL domain-containing protein [Leptolyngbya sp. LCM1.Bin17]|nr:MAG: EAL domain-containing protein [Leptolyngbya sp. LCM1.Bin17]